MFFLAMGSGSSFQTNFWTAKALVKEAPQIVHVCGFHMRGTFNLLGAYVGLVIQVCVSLDQRKNGGRREGP